LVGDVRKAFYDPGGIDGGQLEVCGNMLDAIDRAARNDFAAIGVVMAGMSAKLSSALRSLSEVSSGAKIILLAQMYEEPIARQLMKSVSDGTGVADDYLICPIGAGEFCDFVTPVPARAEDTGAAVISVDAKLTERIRELERLATEDDLTGLKNRRYIREFCRQILEHAEKTDGRVTLLIFDIDNFKHYNDLYGHSAGDRILKQAAILIRRCCRAHDVVGRIGGDEFAVVFWDDPQLREADAEDDAQHPTQRERRAAAEHPSEPLFVAERFRAEFGKAELHLLGPKGEGVLTISGGLASFPRDGSTTEELFRQADNALLEAKRSGKNRLYLVGEPQNGTDRTA
jgi:diguanylate cyclase (GGDEF)-like protein